MRLLPWMLLFAALANSCAPRPSAIVSEQPNIVFILADDLGYGDLSCYGQTHFSTPALDRLAAEGIQFTACYAGSTVCAPSRASLMTGRHTGTAWVRGNYETGPFGFGAGLALRPQDTTLAQVLKSVGYHTALIGKWGLGVTGSGATPRQKGFDYFFGFENQGHAHRQFPEWLWRNEERVHFPENLSDQTGVSASELFTREALDFISTDHQQPFFLYLAYTVPHAEMWPPDDSLFDGFKGKFEEKPFEMQRDTARRNGFGPYRSQTHPQAAYAAMVVQLDRDIARLVAVLKEKGLDKRTLIVFTSDNGPHAEGGFSPGAMASTAGLRGKKRDLYEGGIRVPCIVWQPGTVPAGKQVATPVVFWDFLPTFAELTQAKSVPSTDGHSLLPLLRGGELAMPDRPLYWEFHEQAATAQAIRKGKWKAVRLRADGPVELYDLHADPQEAHDVAAQFPAVVAEMEAAFVALRTPHPIWSLKTP
jgi:arylsulfatase A-like enzyme